jgi:Putative beta-barrel porin-2, OmpL-like. bbp2
MKTVASVGLRAALAGALSLLSALAAIAQAPPQTPTPVAAAPAAPAPPPVKAWYEELSVNAFVSASYSYNFNRPASGTNQLRVFDFDDNTFKVDVAEIVLQKSVAKPGEAGFRIDFVAGSSIPRVSSSYGLLQGQDVDLQQAFVSWIAPVGSGLRLDLGKFITHFGYEVIEGFDGWNDNATHSFAFGYETPFTHTGIKASYTFSEHLAGMCEIVNGWDDARDNNTSKSIGAQLTWTPSKAVTVYGNFMTGPERPNVNSDPRTTFNAVAQWRLTPLTVFTVDALYGSEKGAVTPGETATWWAIAGYARLGLSDAFAFCLRAEYFDDAEGARTGTAQKLTEVTVTPEWKATPRLIFRADLRVDWSNTDVFVKNDGAFKGNQATVFLNGIYVF